MLRVLEHHDSACSPGRDDPSAGEASQLNDRERKLLLLLARQSLVSAARGIGAPAPPAANLGPRLAAERACFVTLMKGGMLRGCIGEILPQEPLCEAVISNARAAALRDPRFEPVEPDEVDQIRIEISVLTLPSRVSFDSPESLLEQLRPHTDGVVLEIAGRSATFLPQVWKQIPDKSTFLEHLCRKAGYPPWAWREKGVSVSTYQVESFEEEQLT